MTISILTWLVALEYYTESATYSASFVLQQLFSVTLEYVSFQFPGLTLHEIVHI